MSAKCQPSSSRYKVLCHLEHLASGDGGIAGSASGCGENATTRLRPWNRRGGLGVDSIEPRANLKRPRRFGVTIYFRIEASNQFACELGSLLIRESKRFCQQVLGIHGRWVAGHADGFLHYSVEKQRVEVSAAAHDALNQHIVSLDSI